MKYSSLHQIVCGIEVFTDYLLSFQVETPSKNNAERSDVETERDPRCVSVIMAIIPLPFHTCLPDGYSSIL